MAENGDLSDLDLPEPAKKELGRVFGGQPRVPAEIDRLVTSRARMYLVRQRKLRIWTRWAAVGGLAAAVAVGVSILHHPARQPVMEANSGITGDLNGDGRIDMLDVYLLARHVHDNDPLQKSWDINADGKIDQADIDALAAKAVKVGDRSQQ